MCYSGLRRRGCNEGGDNGEARRDSIWSSAQLQASEVVPARISIDWNDIRENKGKYEELKWKGKGSYHLSFCYDINISIIKVNRPHAWL